MMNRNVLVGGACVLAVVAAVAIWAVSGGGDEQPGRPEGLVGQPVDQTVNQSGNQSAMVTYIDPVTGERKTEPAGGVSAPLGDAFDSSQEDIVFRPSPVPGGGIGFDTNGRFRSAAVATADSDSVIVECEPAETAGETAGGGRR